MMFESSNLVLCETKKTNKRVSRKAVVSCPKSDGGIIYIPKHDLIGLLIDQSRFLYELSSYQWGQRISFKLFSTMFCSQFLTSFFLCLTKLFLALVDLFQPSSPCGWQLTLVGFIIIHLINEEKDLQLNFRILFFKIARKTYKKLNLNIYY